MPEDLRYLGLVNLIPTTLKPSNPDESLRLSRRRRQGKRQLWTELAGREDL